MSTVYFTSDTHFNHPKVAQLRGFATPNAHDDTVMERWNDTVRPDDEVWHLGDVGMGGIARYQHHVERLHGTIHLVTGNHDDIAPGVNRRAHAHQRAWLEVFASTQQYARRRIRGTTVLLCHYPYDGDHTPHDRHTQFRLRDEGAWLLHGHVHQPGKVTGRQIHVGLDAWDLAPASIDQIAALMDTTR